MITPQAKAQFSPEAIANYLRYSEDPWAFLTECVFTKDQVATGAGEKIKQFPNFPYLKLYVRVWQKYRLLATPKSRRMIMSWTNIALDLWDVIFHPVTDYAFVSKKEDDAADLVQRAEFIFDHIPEDKIPKALLPKKTTRSKPPALIFEEIQSKIQGFPSGANQLRQFTFTGILGDECAFWEDARQFYSSSYPTIEGGGRMTLISSRSPGFFQRLVFDQLDNENPIDEERFPAEVKFPLGDDSVKFWINPKNKFAIFDVHYTANPQKRDPAFRESIRAAMPIKDFMVEYERNWDTYEGKPVFEDYSKSRHEARTEQKPHLGLPLLIGWDFGLTPAAIICQLQGLRLVVLREYVAEHSGIERFAPHVMRQIAQHYPRWSDAREQFRHYIDPAGLAEAQTDQKTCAGIMFAAGIRSIFAGPIDWESRRTAVEHFLLYHDKDGPGLILHAPSAPTLAKGFSGGYVYPEKYAETEPGKPKPVKNRYSHPHDALQYVAAGALALLGKRSTLKSVPTPSYAFGAGKPAPLNTSPNPTQGDPYGRQ